MFRKYHPLTKSNDVAEHAELAEVEWSVLDLLATSEKADGDWAGIGGGQADDTNTGESGESGRRTEIDDAKDNLNGHAEHHGVERHVQSLVDLDPQVGAGNSTVTSKSPCATRGGGGASNSAHDGEDNQGNEKGDGTARGADSLVNDLGHGLGRVEGGDLGQDEHDRDEEEETGEGVEDNCTDHGLGHLDRRVLDLLAHAEIRSDNMDQRYTGTAWTWHIPNDHTSRRSRVTGVQKTDHERPASGPARGGFERSEHILGRATTVLGHDEDRDDDGKDTTKGPEDGSSLHKQSISHGYNMSQELQGRLRGGRGILHQAEAATCFHQQRRHCRRE